MGQQNKMYIVIYNYPINIELLKVALNTTTLTISILKLQL